MATQTITASGVALTGLITSTEYNSRANLSAPSNSAQIQQSIYDSTEFLMGRTDRWFVDAECAMTDVFLMSGSNQKEIFTPQGPILSITSIELWNGSSWAEIDSAVYDQLTDGNKIWFRSGNVWAKGTENWRITYTFGYKGGVPEDLKRACYELSRFYIKQKTPDLQSQTDGEQSFSYFANPTFPQIATDVVARYRRFATRG